MRKSITLAFVCLLVATFFTLPAQAQCTITGSPAFALNGGASATWAYKLTGFNTNCISAFAFVSAVARFTASVGTTPRAPTVQQGIVASSISINNNGTSYTTLMPVTGSFQIDTDCAGGTIQLASGTNSATVRSVRFVFAAAGTKLLLMSSDNDGVVLTGEAARM